MKFKTARQSIVDFRGDAVIVNLFEGVKKPGGATGAVDKALAGAITRAIHRGELSGKLGETLTIHTLGRMPCDAVIIVGLGQADAFGAEEIRRASAAAVNQAGRLKARTVGTIVHGAGIGGVEPEIAARALTEGAILARYQFTNYKKADPTSPDTVVVIEREPVKLKMISRGIETGQVLAESQNIARDLTNEPANNLTPEKFDRRIRDLIARYGLTRQITHAAYGPKEIKALKMGALWSVAQGSENEPRFIVLTMGRKRPRLCLIGKTVTFDSGGISLKPAEGMGRMKGDMSGGGIVVATLIALARARIGLDVMVIVPAVENLPSGRASRPGDVVTAMDGTTIEIISTDAEGRMTLADAICYAERSGTSLIVDIATLTGGAMVAFGDVASAVMGNDQPTVDAILSAATAAGERMWQLPMFPEYDEKVKSDIADLKNSAGREGSPITAGSFLKAFTKDARWVHIDIAGREISERERFYQPKGATGHGVRTLFEFCRTLAKRSTF